MHKIIFFLILDLFTALCLNAKEPTLAILNGVHNNLFQKFSIGQYSFLCEPYGVIGLEKIYFGSDTDPECKKSIEKFYIREPALKYFSYDVLKLKQTYHVEFKENKCLIYAKGQITLSELLLKEGLAFLDPDFSDEEFQYSYEKAELAAKFNKDGLWGENILQSCTAEIQKE